MTWSLPMLHLCTPSHTSASANVRSPLGGCRMHTQRQVPFPYGHKDWRAYSAKWLRCTVFKSLVDLSKDSVLKCRFQRGNQLNFVEKDVMCNNGPFHQEIAVHIVHRATYFLAFSIFKINCFKNENSQKQ